MRSLSERLSPLSELPCKYSLSIVTTADEATALLEPPNQDEQFVGRGIDADAEIQ